MTISPRGSSRDFKFKQWLTAVANEHVANIQKFDEQINSSMTKSSRKNIRGMPIYVCNVCGKEGKHRQARDHIEANHLEGVPILCNFCEKMFRSRDNRRKLQTKDHPEPVEQKDWSMKRFLNDKHCYCKKNLQINNFFPTSAYMHDEGIHNEMNYFVKSRLALLFHV